LSEAGASALVSEPLPPFIVLKAAAATSLGPTSGAFQVAPLPVLPGASLPQLAGVAHSQVAFAYAAASNLR